MSVMKQRREMQVNRPSGMTLNYQKVKVSTYLSDTIGLNAETLLIGGVFSVGE